MGSEMCIRDRPKGVRREGAQAEEEGEPEGNTGPRGGSREGKGRSECGSGLTRTNSLWGLPG